MATRAQAEAAEVSLRTHLAQAPWFGGTDLALLKCGGDSAEIMVFARGTAEQVRAFVDCPYTPKQWQGVPLQYVARPNGDGLSGASLSTQDYANLAVGGMVLAGTFIVGKIAVNSIIEHRREHFERKGQPPEAVKAKETTMDGIVKLGAMALSMYMMNQQLPELLGEVKKLLE